MSFDEDKYVIAKNLLSTDLCRIIEHYVLEGVKSKHRVDFSVLNSRFLYADPVLNSILYFIKPTIETYTNRKLIPTYTYCRNYKPGSVLNPHVDRESCEISVSIPIGYKYIDKSDDYNWYLYVKNENDENRYLKTDIGEGVIYKGCEITHGRDIFDTYGESYHLQLFLHYVDANGSYQHFKFDGKRKIDVVDSAMTGLPIFKLNQLKNE